MNLTELPAGLFDGLEYLHGLHLQGNKLRTLPEGLFRNLSNLWKLHLQGNKLRTLPGGLFRNLSSLEKLDLQGNKLRTLPEGLFRNLSSLEKLDLQGNKLRTLPEGLFRNLSSLEKLDLQGNKLRTLPEGLFRNLSSLEKLDLQGNKLRTLPEGLLRNLRSLSELHLQGNCLRTLPEGLFRNLSGLRSLYLQKNGLGELPSSACAKPCWFDISPRVVALGSVSIGCVGWRFESGCEGFQRWVFGRFESGSKRFRRYFGRCWRYDRAVCKRGWSGGLRRNGSRAWKDLDLFGKFRKLWICRDPKGSQGLRKGFGGFRSHLEGSGSVRNVNFAELCQEFRKTLLLEQEFEWIRKVAKRCRRVWQVLEGLAVFKMLIGGLKGCHPAVEDTAWVYLLKCRGWLPFLSYSIQLVSTAWAIMKKKHQSSAVLPLMTESLRRLMGMPCLLIH